MKEKENCEHSNMELVGAIADTHLCIDCGENLISHEIEILNCFYEVGGFCGNEKCKRYLLLVI